MPRSMQAPLRERKAQEMAREREIAHVMRDRAKPLEKLKRDNKQKKKPVGELYAQLDLQGIEGSALRDACSYVPRSHNLERQLHGLVNHMFVRYPVPAFLYQACLKESNDAIARCHAVHRQWFLALAQGMSFTKLVKGLMTGREAFVFLAAPAGRRIHENVWWAKMKVAGLPEKVISLLIDRIFANRYGYDHDARLSELIRFCARYHDQMSRVTFGEITDFLDTKLRDDAEFTLKGRTLGSVIRLATQWHTLIQKARLGHNVEWRGMEMPDWVFEARDRIWKVTELRSNGQLMYEGRRQKHCVYSYVHWCVAGRSAIFSLRSYRKVAAEYTTEGDAAWDFSLELDQRITIEADPAQRAVVQMRGPINRMPTDDEMEILRRWAGDKGLTVKRSRWS